MPRRPSLLTTMAHDDRIPAGPLQRSTDARHWLAPAAAFADCRDAARRETGSGLERSPHMAAQRQAVDALHHSPAMVAQRRGLAAMFGPPAQLQPGSLDRDAPLQSGFEASQRVAGEEAPAQAEPGGGPPVLAGAAPRSGLPGPLRSGVESLSGLSMAHVRVHYNSAQPAQLNALAYARGSDIHLGPGQEQHLPHEAWHVVQQAQGRVAPTLQMKDGMSLNDDAALEHEADAMGARATATAAVGAAGVAGRTLRSPSTPGPSLPVQRRANQWAGTGGTGAPTLRDEILSGLQLPESALKDLWNKPPLPDIQLYQSKHGLLPNESSARLSEIHSDRDANPPEVSVHAGIGNLEAGLRSGPEVTPVTLGPISSATLPSEDTSEGGKEDKKEKKESSEPPAYAEWRMRIGKNLERKQNLRSQEGKYQAGHLIAYQFMGGLANAFMNVAPQGAQLNNVAFQNWEHGVLAETIAQVRKTFGGAEEDKVPFLFNYTVSVAYDNGSYEVTPEKLVALQLIPENWRELSTSTEEIKTIRLRKRIPLAWTAEAVPTDEVAKTHVKDTAAYGIVGTKGMLENSSHFEARGPRAIVGAVKKSKGVATLDRKDSPSGFLIVQKAIEAAINSVEQGEDILSKIHMKEDPNLALAILSIPANYDGDVMRRRYAAATGIAIPQLVGSPWLDAKTGVVFQIEQIAELAAELAVPKAWQDTLEIQQLRKRITAIGSDIKARKVSGSKDTDTQIAKLANTAKLLKQARDKLYTKPEDKTSEAYVRANEAFSSASEASTAGKKSLELALDELYAALNLEEKEKKGPLEVELGKKTALTKQGILVRYVSDAVVLQGALADVADSQQRRQQREVGSVPVTRDPRSIDFLDPRETAGGSLPNAPLAFSAQETQP